MPPTIVKLVIQGSGALKELQGITRGTESAAAGERRLAIAAERAARAQVKASQDKARAAEKAAADEQRAADKLAAHWRKVSEQSRSVRERAETASAKASERTAAKQKKASESAAKTAAKAAADKAKADAKAAAESARAADRELQARLRNLDRLRRERERTEEAATRSAAREAAKRVRNEERTIATRRRDATNTLRMAGGVMGGAAAGIVAGGIAAGGTARDVTGVDDAKTRIKKANSFRENLITTAVDAGLSDAEIKGVQDKITSASTKAATAPEEIMGGLSVAHDRFNTLRMFADNIEQIALAAKATSTPMEDFIGMLGSAQTAYGLKSGQLKEAQDILLAGAAEGSIRPKDFAGTMAPEMGTHAMNTGQRGIEGLRQFVGLMQGVGAARPGDAEGTKTRGAQFVQFLNKKQVQQDLENAGIRVRGKDGKIDIGSVVDQIATNKNLRTSTQRQGIFHDMQAREGLDALLGQRSKVLAKEAGAVDFKSMHAVSSKLGAEKTSEKIARLESSGLLDLQRQAIDMQNDTIAHLKEYNEQVVAITKVTNELEKAFGTLGLWASSIGLGGLAIGGTAVAGKLGGKLFGGAAATAAGAGAGAGGAGLLATLGTSVTALGAGALTAGIGVAGAVGGAAGYGIDRAAASEALGGRALSDRLADWFISLDSGMQTIKEARERQDRESGAQKAGLDVHVKVSDDRITVKTVQRDRGAKINTSAGPTMAGAGQ